MMMMMMIMMIMIPILVTLVGIVTDVSDEHSLKAETPDDMVRVSVSVSTFS